MEPYDSTDLTEVMQEDERGFLVMKSLDSAESSPDYRILFDFPTREEAEKFLKARIS